MSIKQKKIGFKIILISSLFIPLFEVFIIIGFNSNQLIKKWIMVLLIVILFLLIVGLIIGLKLFYDNYASNKRKIKKWLKNLLIIFMVIYILGCTSFVVLLYGPYKGFKEWLITTAMKTMNHQYLCKWFYSEDDINEVMNENYIIESDESTNVNLIKKHKFKYKKDSYKNEYEEAILDVEDDIKYKIIELEVNGCNGYLAVVYDPSLVKLAVTKGIGYSGQYVTTMTYENNGIIGINGGGFYDPNYNSAGGTPLGITISDGKIITNGEYGTNNQGGGIIGFTNNDEFVLLKNTTANEAIEMGVRDAVSWGPFLIVNGEKSFIKGNGGWGYAARTAIGQRADGIVLLLVIDSNATRTKGADMVDLTEIMYNYGAINAANLDGGTSSVMVMPKDIAKSKYNAKCNDIKDDYFCAINDPIDGGLSHRTRAIADAWIVLDK